MFSNIDGSEEFEAFLDLLGERVRLKGFDRYAAQLDVKSAFHTPYVCMCVCVCVCVCAVVSLVVLPFHVRL